MVMSKQAAIEAARTCMDAYTTHEAPRLERIQAYMKGRPNDIYLPPSAEGSLEFDKMRRKAVVNYLRLIVSVMSQGLIVEGYRTATAPTQEANTGWRAWQANGLDARQVAVHRSTLTFGVGYATVLPGTQPVTGENMAAIRARSARKLTALYREEADEWPEIALYRVDGRNHRLYDEEAEYLLARTSDGVGEWQVVDTREHNAGVCPVVRFADRYQAEGDDFDMGLVEPVMSIQDQINEGRLDLLVAQKFASFRQRWATGLEIPKDPDTGQRVEPFKSAVDRLWIAEDEGVTFGEFSQTDTGPYINAHSREVQDLSAISQVAPQHLLGAMANLSAEALAAAEAGQTRQTQEIQLSVGESWEQTLRLACSLMGDAAAAADFSSSVDWRDVQSRSLAQTVDALGKLAQMLGVPAEILWEKIPGFTQDDVDAAKAAAARGSALSNLTDLITAQANGLTPAPQPGEDTSGVTL